MWNLSGDDIQRAKEELKGRRAAIKVHYDNEMKQLEADIAAIETFERAAVNFVSNFKGEDLPSATVADPGPAPEKAAADSTGKQSSSTRAAAPIEESAAPEPALEPAAEPAPESAAEPAPAPGPAVAERGSSRWRMRLSTTESTP